MANDLEQGKDEAAYMERLIKAAQDKAERNQLKDVHGSLLVSVGGKGEEPSTLVRLDLHKDGEQSGSELPLQDEFSFHLMLAARVYGQIAKDPEKIEKIEKIEIARQDAMKRVNRYIKRAYRDAYRDAYKVAEKDGAFDLAKFNTSLDKARKKLVPMAHTILMEKIIEKTGIILTAKDLKNAKHLAEITPATTQDILYVNKAAGLVTLIKGSEHTAHLRVAGKNFAHRQMITCRIDDKGMVIPGLNPRIQIRTPSPVVKKKKKDFGDHEIILDVAAKLSEITDVYDLKNQLNKKPKAFIYNRYTAIKDWIGDFNGNLQTQSAAHILQGAHEYNAKNINNGVFCFVQNISVNGFGDTLSYQSSDPLVRESTLMAEMALMHTLCEPKELAVLNGVVENYKDYLKTSPRARYFSETTHGNEARESMLTIKNGWKNKGTLDTKVGSDDEKLVLSVKMSLKKLVAHDLHLTHEYAKLVQTLSVFSEEASIGGCKSGNERAQAINGRVLMLDGMKPGSKLPNQLMELAHASSDDVLTKATELNKLLNAEYNEKGLYAAASVVSLVDQGASAKVEAKPKGFYISRNFGEESAEQMTNLKQSKAGAMQAHKGLTKSMKGAWTDYAMSDWSYMSSSSLGTLGAVAAVMTVIPAILAVITNRLKKQQKIEARHMHNERIQALQACPQDQNDNITGWLKQIGNYGPKDSEKPALHLSGEEKKALYRATHQGTTPKGAREDFIRFLGLKFLAKRELDDATANKGKTVKLKDLLGDEGFRLYKQAIKEEGKSKAFRRAVFEASREHVEGPAWSKRLILWVGGPSSSGKTYSAMNVLKFLKEKEPKLLGENKANVSGNDVVFADGSFDRELSQMRQMVLQCALASGYQGISDLHKHSQALSVKQYVKEAVLASERFHMVIPETFTRPNAVKEMLRYESFVKGGKCVQLFSEIKAEKDYDERFRTAVKNMGESRAWRTDTFDVSQIKMNNLKIGCESKIYESENFKWGRNLTRVFKSEYKKHSQNKVTLKITNDLMYLQKKDNGQWEECTFNNDLIAPENDKAKWFVFMPARAYNAWLQVKETIPDLVAWYEDNKENNPTLTESIIKLKDNKGNLKYMVHSLSSRSFGLFSKRNSSLSDSEDEDDEYTPESGPTD